MQTKHEILFEDSSHMKTLTPESVDLVVTSPPYPMIEMWDEAFFQLDPAIRGALAAQDGQRAFEGMHQALDRVWQEVCRVLVEGGIACINIGDAARSLDGKFQLYPSHARIIQSFTGLGLDFLPAIIWRKQTNAPNKFMGSGMLPPGAYVTLEHEFILIFRKGNKRAFKTQAEKDNRSASAYFWEERNQWFSDVWFDLKGTRQEIKNKEMRKRSGAYPFDLAYRLINMFSVKGDLVLDPFLGLGTTTCAAMASARNSIGYEIDAHFEEPIVTRLKEIRAPANNHIEERLARHAAFVEKRLADDYRFKYENKPHGFSVMTRQERGLAIDGLEEVRAIDDRRFEVTYKRMGKNNDGG